MISQPGQTFVGRGREMAALGAALDDAIAGHGRLVMLAGEPGIGKTRTAQELAAHANMLGAQTLWGWCYEQQGAPPYWPWVQAIRSYLQTSDAQVVASDMGPGAADIAEIIPQVGELLPGLKPPPPLEPEQARFRLFESITAFLKCAAQRQPQVLMLDDIQWADEPSLMLLEFLARQLPNSHLLVLGCYRDMELSRQHPLSETLSRLARLPGFHRELMRGVNQEDVGRFLEAGFGSKPSISLVETVCAHTGGNPFFMTEIMRLMEDQKDEPNAEEVGDWNIRIPEGVKEAIGQRLNRLSQLCGQTLTTASAIGREFDFNLLCRLDSASSEDDLLEVIEEAVAARLIEELPQGRDRYQFSHALFKQTLSDEITSSRKVRLHARIAQALEERYGGEADAHAGELAHYFAEAEAALGPDKLIFYSLLAGEKALSTYAHEEALVHFHKGLAARGIPITGDEPAVDAEIAALLFGFGRAQAATLPLPQLPDAVVTLTRSFDYYAKEGDIDQVVAIAEHPFPPTAGRSIGVLQIIERALKLVRPASRQSGRLLAHYGWIMGVVEANYEKSRDALVQAMDIARNEGDTILALQTLISAAEVEQFFLHWEDALSKSLEAIEVLSKIDDPRAEALAHFVAANSLRISTGGLVEAERHIGKSIAAAERLRHHFYLGRALNSACWLSYCKGEWQAARDSSDQGLAVSPRETRLLHTRVMLEYEVGNFSDGKAYLDRLLEVMRLTAPGPVYEYAFPAMLIPMAARISGDREWFDVARAAAENVLSSPSVTPMVAAMTNNGLALLAVQQEDVAVAKQLYQGLERHEIVGTLGIQDDRRLGLLAQTAGNLDKAAEHFEDALAFCRKAGYRPELAWTCHDYADALLFGDQPGDQQMAKSMLEESLSISTILGMRPLMDRVAALQLRAEAQPGRRPAYPDGLSAREVEVLRLIAAGKSNREIAEELFISPNTTGHHVSSIFNKTGAANRAEATGYAIRRGLSAE